MWWIEFYGGIFNLEDKEASKISYRWKSYWCKKILDEEIGEWHTAGLRRRYSLIDSERSSACHNFFFVFATGRLSLQSLRYCTVPSSKNEDGREEVFRCVEDLLRTRDNEFAAIPSETWQIWLKSRLWWKLQFP